MEVKVNNKTYEIRELLAVELDKILENQDKKEILKNQVLVSTGLSDEEYSKLTVKERLTIVQAINKLNGFEDFQKNSN